VDGLVLDSTYADVAHVAEKRLPLGPLAGAAVAIARAFAVPLTGRTVLDAAPAEVATTARGAQADLPVLVLHAAGDPLVPFGEAELLREAYGGRATLVRLEGNAHAGGVIFDAERYAEALRGFAERVEGRAMGAR
jgi:pimeloyl-ACP methyl ester carboxylesterase